MKRIPVIWVHHMPEFGYKAVNYVVEPFDVHKITKTVEDLQHQGDQGDALPEPIILQGVILTGNGVTRVEGIEDCLYSIAKESRYWESLLYDFEIPILEPFKVRIQKEEKR